MIPLVALVLSCGTGSVDRSHVQRLTVLAIAVEPAEASLDETLAIDVVVADPVGTPAVVMLWSCAAQDGTCLEGGYLALHRWLAIAPLEGGHARFQRTIPRTLASRIWPDGSTESAEISLAALACEVGECPVIERATAELAAGGEASAELVGDLADPQQWLAELPFDGNSLAVRSLAVWASAPLDRNRNPRPEARFPGADGSALELDAGAWSELAFWAADPDGDVVYLFPRTTVGRFDDDRLRAYSNVARVYLRAETPEEEGTAYVVFDDGRGGVAVWERDVTVR